MNHNGNDASASASDASVDFQNSERSLGEGEPLLRSSSVISSTRSVDSTSGGGYFGFSSHWLNTANRDRQELFRSERDRAVEKGIVQAAFLIRDAVLGESENPSKGTYDPYLNPENSVRNLLSLIFRQILSHRMLRKLTYAVVWTLALLTFVEPPRWCRDGYDGDESQNCQVLFHLKGPAAGSETLDENNATTTVSEEDFVEYYPSTNSMLLTREQSNMIEWICISIFSLRIIFLIGRDGCSLARYLRRGPAQTIRLLQLLAIGMIFLGLWFEYTFFQPFARLLLLGTLLKILHQEVETTLEIVRKALWVMNTVLSCIVLYCLMKSSFTYCYSTRQI